ncbi:hypothetical protein ACAX43_32625 [Paraburkholderia sp. IW21]|jgi:hypothetical protein|uniref:hypothetical protein n=1 Tax=Paraburkholderia sp. IW21 TaxID=3242488 RepID=UPI00352227AC
MTNKSTDWIPVTYESGGYRLDGRYKIESGMITVSCINGTKKTQVGNTPADMLARLILSEMASIPRP